MPKIMKYLKAFCGDLFKDNFKIKAYLLTFLHFYLITNIMEII